MSNIQTYIDRIAPVQQWNIMNSEIKINLHKHNNNTRPFSYANNCTIEIRPLDIFAHRPIL